MLNKIIISCIFLIVPFVLFGQINNTDKGAATIYTRGVPTGAVRIKYDSEWAIDINTSKIYRYNRTTNSWGEAGSFIGKLESSSAPTGAPKYGGPEFIINSDKELYWYNAGVWHCINCSSSLTAGTGIDITGTVITNTAPDQIVTITDGGIVTVGGTYPNFTITATEVDGDPINELQFIDSLYISNDTLFISLDRDSIPSKAIKLTGLNDGNGIYGGSDTIPDLVYAFSDSSKTFALGQFPSFPNVSTNGTTQGFYYNPDNSVKLLNGDNTSGWRNEFSLEPNIARVRTLTIDNLNATTQFQRALIDDSWYVLQGTINNDIYGDIQIVTKLDDDEELINLSQSGRGDTLGVSMYLGKGDPNSAYYNDVNRAWGVKTDLTANEEFHWIKIHLPGNNDTVSNTIKLYEKYYFPNEQPSVILSDTSIIGWIGDGTNANPVFLPYNSGGSSLDTSGYNLDFYIQSDSLYIEDGQSILGVDLSPYLSDLDEQELGIDSVSVVDNKERFEISISNGNSIFFEVMEYVETEGSIIEGSGVPGDPIQLSEGSNNGEVLMWNQDLSVWEIVLITTTDEIDGTGFATDPLKIAQQGATDTQVLAWDDDSQTWQPKDDLDTDDQTLTLDSSAVTGGQNFILTIEDGNNVSFFIPDPSAGAQTLSIDSTDLVGIERYEISISGGNSIFLDDDDNQIIDTFIIVSNILRLSLEEDGQPFKSVDLSPYLDNTDAQNLTIEGAGPTYDIAISGGTDVTIQGGGIITLSESPANTLIITGTEVDGSTTNEIQQIDTFFIVGAVISASLSLDGVPAKTLDITESTQDIIGGMVTGNTETGITVTYEDSDGTLDFVVNDVSATNEIQRLDTFEIVGNILRASLLNDGVPFSSVDLSAYVNPAITTDQIAYGTGTSITSNVNIKVNTALTGTNIDKTYRIKTSGNGSFSGFGVDSLSAGEIGFAAHGTDSGSSDWYSAYFKRSAGTGDNIVAVENFINDASADAKIILQTLTGDPVIAVAANTRVGLFGIDNDDSDILKISSEFSSSTLDGSYGIGVSTGNLVGIGGAPVASRALAVTGEVRISDLTSDTPTRVVGADADGDLSALALYGMSVNSGTLTVDTTLLATLNDINIQAPRIAYGVGNNMIGGSGNFTFETNTIRLNTTSGNDTLLNFLRSGTSPFSIYQFTDPYNGSTVAYRMGGLNGRRIFLEGFGIYMEAPFYQEETAGIGFIGSTGDLRLHTNGDYYTATLAGDNQTTNRNITFYFTSGGSSTGKGNPIIFQQVHSNNDTLCNSFEFLARNTAVGGITHPDSNLFRIGNWDRGTAVNILHNLNVGIQTRTPTRDLDVNGEVRIRDLVTTNPTFLVGADNDGVLSRVTLGDNLTFDGTTLDAATGGTDINIYNDDGNVQDGGTIVDVSNDDPIIFDLNNVTTETNRILRFEIAHTDDVTTTNILKAVTPSDSITLRSYDSGMYLDYTGTTGSGEGFVISSNTIMDLRADSFLIATIPTKTVLHFLTGMYNNTLTKIEGTTNGQVLVWDETNGYWEIGSAGGNGIYGGSGDIPTGTEAALEETGTFQINFFDGTDGLYLADDTGNDKYAKLQAGNSAVEVGFGIASITGTSTNITLGTSSNISISASSGLTKIQDMGGNATLGGGSSASEFRFMEPSGSGANYTGFVSPALSSNLIYTLPTAATDGYFLKYNSSGNQLEWAAVGASDELILTAAPSSDHTASGIKITLVANENQAFGDACYINSDGEAQLGDADAIATASCIVICLETVTTGNSAEYLLQGIARDDTWAWTVGGLIYLSTTGTTGNTLTQTAPSGTNDVVQILGIATHADRIYFTSNLMQIELN